MYKCILLVVVCFQHLFPSFSSYHYPSIRSKFDTASKELVCKELSDARLCWTHEIHGNGKGNCRSLGSPERSDCWLHGSALYSPWGEMQTEMFFLIQCLCAKRAKVAGHHLSQVSVPSHVSMSPGPWEQQCLQDPALSSGSTCCLALLSLGAWKVGFLSDARHRLWKEYSLHLWTIFGQGDFHVSLMFKKFS